MWGGGEVWELDLFSCFVVVPGTIQARFTCTAVVLVNGVSS